jgi:hypothetical protein
MNFTLKGTLPWTIKHYFYTSPLRTTNYSITKPTIKFQQARFCFGKLRTIVMQSYCIVDQHNKWWYNWVNISVNNMEGQYRWNETQTRQTWTMHILLQYERRLTVESTQIIVHNVWSRIIPLKKKLVAGVTVLTLESGILLLVRWFLDFNAGLLLLMVTLRCFVNGILAA